MVHIWQRRGVLRKDPWRKRSWCSDRGGETHGQKEGQSLWAGGKVGLGWRGGRNQLCHHYHHDRLHLCINEQLFFFFYIMLECIKILSIYFV